MAAIKCRKCNTYISVRGIAKCPKCQTEFATEDTTKIEAKVAGRTPLAGATQTGNHSSSPVWLGFVVLGGIVISAAAIITSLLSSSPEKQRKELIGLALVKCQYAVQSTAKFGGGDLPPYVKNNSRDMDDEFNFGWPRGSFYFTNGFGAREAMSASCTGTLSTGKIMNLTINAKDML